MLGPTIIQLNYLEMVILTFWTPIFSLILKGLGEVHDCVCYECVVGLTTIQIKLTLQDVDPVMTFTYMLANQTKKDPVEPEVNDMTLDFCAPKTMQ